MSPILDPSKWSLPVVTVAVMLGATVTATAGVVKLIFQVDDIQKTLKIEMAEVIHADEFKIWMLATEKSSPGWTAADIEKIRRHE